MRKPQTNRYEESVSNLKQKIEEELLMCLHSEQILPTADPIAWWKKENSRYPQLAMVARRYLAIPCTSVESERLSSSAGDIVTDKRTSLSPETVSCLIFLYKILS